MTPIYLSEAGQFGFATSGGFPLWLVSVDTRNAFNYVSRTAIMKFGFRYPVRRPLLHPQLLPGSPTFFKIDSCEKPYIPSANGVQKGDLLGVVLFCVSILSLRVVPNTTLPSHLSTIFNLRPLVLTPTTIVDSTALQSSLKTVNTG